jgi:TP901 family phage tail tape measure protein
MADIESNIKISIDTSSALENIKNLQRQVSAFQSSLANAGASAASAASNMQQNFINSVNATGKFSAGITNIKTTTESFTNALEKNKLSMGEYFRYAGGASKSFGKLFKTEFDTINRVATERVKDLQTQYIKLGRDVNGSMKAISVRPLALDMENLATKQAIASQRQQLLNQLLKQGSTNLLNFGKNTQWAGRQLMVGFTIPLIAAGSAATKAYMQLEKASIAIRKVYGDLNTSAADTEQAVRQIQKLALEYTKYGVAVADTMDMAAKAAAMGKTGADLLAQINQAVKLSVLGGVDQEMALETTISLTNAFGLATEKLAGKVNFLNAVENQTVLAIEDMTIAIPKAAPVVKQLGGDIEDLAFFLTAMKEGGINASEGANALKSGLASLINPTKASSDFLMQFGVNVKQIVEADKGDLKKTVVDFAKALDTLDPLNRARAIEQMFGKFQFARISTLLQNVTKEGSQASKVMDLASMSSIQLAAVSRKELEKMEASPMFKFQKALAELQLKLAPIGETFLKVVTPIIEKVSGFLEGFNKMGDSTKQFILGLTVVVAGLGPVLLMTFGLIANGVANITKGFATLKSFFNRTTNDTMILGEQTSFMTQEQIKAHAVAASLDQIHTKLTQTFTTEASAVNAYTAALERAVVVQSSYSGATIPRTRTNLPKFAGGGMVRGPGTGTSDSILARVSNGEAIIPAKSVARYPDVVSGLVSGNIPGFAEGDKKIDVDKLGKGYKNATIFMPESMNTEMGSPIGKGANTADVSQYFKKAGSAAMAPLMSVMAKEMGLKLNDPNLFEEWKSVGEKLSNATVTALGSSTKQFIKDSDIEQMLIPAFKDAAKGVKVAGQDLSQALENSIDRVYTVGAVGTQSGNKDRNSGNVTSGGRNPLDPRAYIRQRRIAQEMAMKLNPEMYTRDIVPSTSKGTKNLFRTLNPTTGQKEMATAAHISPSVTASVRNLVAQTEAFVTNAFDKIIKGTSKAVANGTKAVTKTASPSRETTQIGKDIGQGFINGATPVVKESVAIGKKLQQSALSELQLKKKNLEMMGQDVSAIEREIAQRKALAQTIVAQTAAETSQVNNPTILPSATRKLGYKEQGPLLPGQKRQGKIAGRIQDFAKGAGSSLASNLGGVAIAASMAAGALSMVPGPIGQISQAVLPIVSAMSMAAMILPMFGTAVAAAILPITIGVGLLVGGFMLFNSLTDQANKAREKEIERINATSDAYKNMPATVDALGALTGRGKSASIGQSALASLKSGSTLQQASDVQTLLDSGEFKNEGTQTNKDIGRLKLMSQRQANTYLTALGQQLIASGENENNVNAIMTAMASAAGKKDLKISFKSLDLNTAANRKSFGTSIQNTANAANELQGKATTIQRGYLGIRPEDVARYNAAIGTKAEEVKLNFVALNDQFAKGIITQKAWSASTKIVTDNLLSMNEAARQATIDQMFKDAGPEAVALQNSVKGINSQMLMFQILTMGGTDALRDLKAALLEVPKKVGIRSADAAERADKAGVYDKAEGDVIQKKYDDLVKKLPKTLAGLEAQTDATNNTSTANKELPKTIADIIKGYEELSKVSTNQVNAFRKLREAGVDAASAYEIVSDAEAAYAINAENSADKVREVAKAWLKSKALAQLAKDPLQVAIDKAQLRVDINSSKIDTYNSALSIIGDKEKTINDEYDKRIKALDDIQAANKEINQSQKDQMDLAEALSRGDIAAAAKAAQTMRDNASQNALDKQKEALSKSKDLQLQAITQDVNGKLMTRLQIEEKIRAVQLDSYNIQLKEIDPIKEKLALQAQFQQEQIDKGISQGIATTTSKTTLLAWAQKNSNADYKEIMGYASQVSSAKTDAAKATPRANALKVYTKLQDLYNARPLGAASGGMIMPKYFAAGGFSMGTDIVPAMLTPGEFIVSQPAVRNFGVDNLKSINNGTYDNGSVYNYSVNVSVRSGANADEIARNVMTQIKQIDSQRVRGINS